MLCGACCGGEALSAFDSHRNPQPPTNGLLSLFRSRRNKYESFISIQHSGVFLLVVRNGAFAALVEKKKKKIGLSFINAR